MSTIAISSPSRPDSRSGLSADLPSPTDAQPSGIKARARARVSRKKSLTKRRIEKVMTSFEEGMHYAIAFVLSGIAVATMVETTRTLLMTPPTTTFATATSNAVGGVLIVLILVEITRTVITPPDSKGVAIRRLLVIAIMSALREVLWVGVNSEAGSATTGKSIAMAVSSAVVVGLAVAFTLVRRASSDKAS